MTCQTHIEAAIRNRFAEHSDPCRRASAHVLQRCPSCASCPLDNKGCPATPGAKRNLILAFSTTSSPYNCDIGYPHGVKIWAAKKKEWCCQSVGRACPQKHPTERYDCDVGYDN